MVRLAMRVLGLTMAPFEAVPFVQFDSKISPAKLYINMEKAGFLPVFFHALILPNKEVLALVDHHLNPSFLQLDSSYNRYKFARLRRSLPILASLITMIRRRD